MAKNKRKQAPATPATLPETPPVPETPETAPEAVSNPEPAQTPTPEVGTQEAPASAQEPTPEPGTALVVPEPLLLTAVDKPEDTNIPMTAATLERAHAAYAKAITEVATAIQEIQFATGGKETTALSSLRWGYSYLKKELSRMAVKSSTLCNIPLEPAPEFEGVAEPERRKDAVTVADGWHGHSTTALIRWMGKQGFNYKKAAKALGTLMLPAAEATIRTQLQCGKKGLRGEPAELTAAQVELVLAACA